MPSLLIVGGGFAGVTAAQALLKAKKYSVTLVDRKDYFEITPAQLRALVAPETGDRTRIFYRDLVGSAFVQGEVTALEADAALLADGSRLSFDTLILAPGTRYPRFATAKPTGQTTKALRAEHNQAEHARFAAAPGYLVIGGGLVGVELAGELTAYAPGKPVRLAHQGPRLVENLSEKASALALEHLKALGVAVELNQGNAQAENGELVYTATSPEPATEFLRAVSPPVLDTRHRIVVDEYLAVKGHKNWYAVGDANDAPGGKQSMTASAQAAHLVKALLAGTSKKYKPAPAMALAPLGKTHGFAQTPFGAVTWKPLVNMKRKDLLVGMFRKILGVKEV